jgi:uncharacterized membrane protein
MPEEKKVEKKTVAAAPASAPASAPKKTFEGGDKDSNLFAALCYLISFWVPLFVLFTEKKNDKYVAFHAYQDLLLTAAMIVYFIVAAILSAILTAVTAVFGGIGGFCILPFMFLPLILILVMTWKAYQGEKYKLPVIGDMAEKYVK